MRENRTHGSEGGDGESRFRPLSVRTSPGFPLKACGNDGLWENWHLKLVVLLRQRNPKAFPDGGVNMRTETVTVERIDHGVIPSNDLGRAHRFWGTFTGGRSRSTNLNIRALNREVPQIVFIPWRITKAGAWRCRTFRFLPRRRARWKRRLRFRSGGDRFNRRDACRRKAETQMAWAGRIRCTAPDQRVALRPHPDGNTM